MSESSSTVGVAANPNFFYLLAALVVFLLSIPIAEDLGLSHLPLVRGLIFSGIVIIGVWSLRGGARFFQLGMLFVVASIAMNILAANTQSLLIFYGSLLPLIGFLLVAITFTLRRVAVGTDISANRIAGAICVYLLLGVIWALCYAFLEFAAPGSFTGFASADHLGVDSQWFYFSFVTITTLGYGDLLPLSGTARVMAYTEAVVGQLYIAILVAGLVGAYISGKSGR